MRASRVSDSNSIAMLERTSLTVYEADIFNCSRHPLKSTGQLDSAHSRDQPVHRPARETLCLVPPRGEPDAFSAALGTRDSKPLTARLSQANCPPRALTESRHTPRGPARAAEIIGTKSRELLTEESCRIKGCAKLRAHHRGSRDVTGIGRPFKQKARPVHCLTD
jgi:hypothetical protein